MLKSFAVILFLLSGSSFSKDLTCRQTFGGGVEWTELYDRSYDKGDNFYKSIYNNPFYIHDKNSVKTDNVLWFKNIGSGVPSSKEPTMIGFFINPKAEATLTKIDKSNSETEQFDYVFKDYGMYTYSFFIDSKTPKITLIVSRILLPLAQVYRYTCK